MIRNSVKSLPDSFAKGASSNNNKLILLNSQIISEFCCDILDVVNCIDLGLATGKTLDLFGDMVGQKRGALNDVQYRYMIFTRIARNLVQGDYQSIMDSIVRMFNCNYEDVALEDVSFEDDARPCVVRLIKLPVFVLVGAGFTSTQAVQMIESILPICVTLAAENFEGTFEFSAVEYESTMDTGFADEAQTYGGYLGLMIGDDANSLPLPI